MNPLYIALGAIVLLVVGIIGAYNSLVRKRNYVENAEAQIDTQLERRYDLIPQLVKVAKAYMNHERETLTAITEARSHLKGDRKKAMEASDQISGALGKLFAVAENYPELKANENFLQVQEALTGTEDKIAYARSHYNKAVRNYDTAKETFPNNIIAGMFNFKEKPYLQIEEDKREVPEIEL